MTPACCGSRSYARSGSPMPFSSSCALTWRGRIRCKSSFALGGGFGIRSPKFTSPSDSLVLFPIELFASYRRGFAEGRFQRVCMISFGTTL